MALTNFKNNVGKPTDDDEYARLLCSVLGCGKIWTVKIDKPMCSFHQWGPQKDQPKKGLPTPKTPPVKPFTEVEDEF